MTSEIKSFAYLGKEDVYNFLIFVHFFFGNILLRKTGYLLCDLGFTLLSKTTNGELFSPCAKQSTNVPVTYQT